MIRTLTRLALLVLFAASTATASFADDTDQQGALTGTWLGIVYQHNTPPYPAVMQFTSDLGGISDYPTYPCAGKLSRVMDDNKIIFAENITFTEKAPDNGGCINGYITVEVYGDEMDWSWRGAPPDEDTIAIATFYKMRTKTNLIKKD